MQTPDANGIPKLLGSFPDYQILLLPQARLLQQSP